MYAILLYCFWVRGKLVEYPRLLIISPQSLNNFWNFPRCPNSRCTGHATMSTERANDRLVTVNYSARSFSCYRTKPKCNFSSSPVRWIHNVRTIVADCVDFFFFFLEKKIKRNRVVKFAKMLIYVWDSAWTLISRSFPRSVDMRDFKKLLRRRRRQRRLKTEFIFYLRILRYSQVIYFVYHCQSCRETESGTPQ